MAIMGGVIAAILAGIATAADTSDMGKKEIGVEVVLRDYAEAVKGATYNGCAVPSGISFTAPTGYAVSATYEACYNGTSTSGGYSGSTDGGAVLLRLEAHSTDSASNRQRSKSLEMVKAAEYERPS